MPDFVKHSFTSSKADGADTTLVRPSNWNDGHVYTGGSDHFLWRRNSADADGADWVDPEKQALPIGSKRSVPYVRLLGQESSGRDVRIVENAGLLSIQRNDGTEATPSWVDLVIVDLVNNRVRPTGQLRLDIDTAARLVLPVGANKYAT
jgi:hypothetical protein